MDAKILISEFLAKQKEQEARRNLERSELPRMEADARMRKPMKPKEVIRYARGFGFSVIDGGRHGVHLVAPNGTECPLPAHGGGRTLAVGTQHSIISFIQTNGTR